jgi:kumamolisin
MKILRLLPLLTVPAFALGTIFAAAAPAAGNIAGVPHDLTVRDLGRAPATARLGLAISLGYRHSEQLGALVDAIGDSGSPYYGHFLQRSQFDAYFSPTTQDYQRVIASLARAGFSVTHLYSNHKLIDAVAPVALVERYFATEIHRVAQPGFGVRYQNIIAARAPADVRGIIDGVVGLDNVGRFHTMYHFAPRRAQSARVDLAVPGQLFGPDTGYGPTAFIDAYQLPVKQVEGKGQVSAVVIDADYLNKDLAGYLTYFGVARTGPPTVRVKIDGGPPPGLGSPDSVETTLDVETIVSLAPATSLYVYEFPNFSDPQYIVDAYEQVVVDDFAGTVNSSFGGCEFGFGNDDGFAKMSDDIALQGAALGITFHASTGDDGNIGTSCSSTTVNSPASNPHFVAVGGTSLYLNASTGALENEYGWGGLGQEGATGGGVSSLFALPSYQKGVANIITSGRNLPDVSFDADPATGESFYYDGSFQGPIGGTSLSSPIFGASQTLLNEQAGREAGFVNPSLYRTFKTYGYANAGVPLFRDMTKGNNGFYAAKIGYDQMTGIGAEIVGDLHPYVR